MNTIEKLSTIDTLGTDKKVDKTAPDSRGSFSEILSKSINEVNEQQINGDKALADLATGEVKDLHQAAIAIGKAETSMKLMLEIRNKALSAYKEISRTQI